METFFAYLTTSLAGVAAALQLRSPRWPSLRKAHLEKEPRCRACGTRRHLNVHHVMPVHRDPTLELVPDNLVTLCESPGKNCHLFFGHLGSWMSWNGSVRSDADAYRARIENRP